VAFGCRDEGTKPSAEPVLVRMSTTKGNLLLELDAERAPITVANFLAYVDAGFYSGTLFHRVIPRFMVQGGGYTEDMSLKPPIRPAIALEARNGLKNVRGAIAMARSGNPNSANCQFFINAKDNPNLDYPKPDGNGYAVFGRVLEGMAVVDSIEAAPTGSVGGLQDVPIEAIVIFSVVRLP
jgi:peptidyl-prolyl cis-trans isomerase A (cyclophilin A)